MRRIAGVLVLCIVMVVPGSTIAQATFPGTNGLIAFYNFAGLSSRRHAQIYTIASDGTGRTALTATLHSSNLDPSWSADGSKIAYINTGKIDRLKIMNADGSGITTVVNGPTARPTLYNPSWSPDGTHIAFCGVNYRGQESVFVVGSDGTGLVNISGTHNDCNPAWSPDGSMIAVDTTSGQILTLSPDGATRTPVIVVGANYSPSWSPNSASLVFARQVGARSDIWSIHADGTGLTQLTATAKRWEFAPAYSPDGTKIVFSRTQGKSITYPDDLWVANPDGSGAVKITNTPRVDEFNVDWQAT